MSTDIFEELMKVFAPRAKEGTAHKAKQGAKASAAPSHGTTQPQSASKK